MLWKSGVLKVCVCVVEEWCFEGWFWCMCVVEEWCFEGWFWCMCVLKVGFGVCVCCGRVVR